jgi:hypothetical protein
MSTGHEQDTLFIVVLVLTEEFDGKVGRKE